MRRLPRLLQARNDVLAVRVMRWRWTGRRPRQRSAHTKSARRPEAILLDTGCEMHAVLSLARGVTGAAIVEVIVRFSEVEVISAAGSADRAARTADQPAG